MEQAKKRLLGFWYNKVREILYLTSPESLKNEVRPCLPAGRLSKGEVKRKTLGQVSQGINMEVYENGISFLRQQ